MFEKYKKPEPDLAKVEEIVIKADVSNRLISLEKELIVPGKIIPVERPKVEQVRVIEKIEPSDLYEKLKKVERKIDNQIIGLPGVEYFQYTNIRFMKDLKRYELKHKDHSSIIVAKKCLRKYFYKEVLCLVPKEQVTVYLPWGSAYHIFRQRLSEHYGFGDNEPRLFDVDRAKKAFAKANLEAMMYWSKYGENQKAGSKLDWFTEDRFNKTTMKAFDWWVNERKMGKTKVLAVEQYFIIQLRDGSFVQGRIDELVRFLDKLYGRDFKTTSKDEDWFTKSLLPNNQIKTYTFAENKLTGSKKRVHGLIIEVMYNAKSTKAGDKGPEVFDKIADCTDYELNQWEEEQIHWNKILQSCRDSDNWPMTEDGCQYCEYQYVCNKGTEAAQMYQLEQKYTRRLRNPANVLESDD